MGLMQGDSGKMERLGSEILHPGVPTAAHDGVPCPGSGAFQVPVAPSAARNGVAYPDMLMAMEMMEPRSSGVPTAPTLNAAPYAGWLTADTNTSMERFTIGVYDEDTMAVFSLLEHHHHTAGVASAGAEEGGGYYNNYGMAVPSAVQVVDDANRDDASVAQDEVAGVVVGPERVPGGLGGMGLAATSLAVAGLTAGIAGVATPATAFALFAALLGGVALITVHVVRA